jgi:hypothetical protein
MTNVAYAATANVWVEPLRIPPGQNVTIHIEAINPQTNITKIEVINPDGISWSWTGEIRLPDEEDEVAITFPEGDEWVVNDGDGDITLPDVSWPSDVNTNTEGEYTVYVYGEELTPSGSAKFDTSSYFGVPEFSVTSALIVAVGFALISMLSRFNKD